MKKVLPLLLVFALIISGGISYFIIASPTKSISEGSDKLIEACVTSKDQTRCFTKYFNQYIPILPVTKLVNQLYNYREKVPKATEYCHETAIRIGVKSWVTYKDIDKVIKVGTSVCASGYLHGAQQAMGDDNSIPSSLLIKDLVKTCNEITNGDPADNNYRSCFHGIGHTVYLRSNDSYDVGLKICQYLSDEISSNDYNGNFTQRELCSEGLTMRYAEYINVSVVKYEGAYPKRSDTNLLANPFILCDKIVDKSLRYGCFSYGSRAFTHDDKSRNRTTTLCNLYPKIDQIPCYYGLSRELAYTASTDTYSNVVTYCNRANDDEAAYHCGVNAILNRITIDNDLKTPIIVCNKLPKTIRFKEICAYVIKNIRLTEGEVNKNITNNR